MHYTQEAKELSKHKVSFTDAFHYLPYDNIIHRRIRDEILYQQFILILLRYYVNNRSLRKNSDYALLYNDITCFSDTNCSGLSVCNSINNLFLNLI